MDSSSGYSDTVETISIINNLTMLLKITFSTIRLYKVYTCSINVPIINIY